MKHSRRYAMRSPSGVARVIIPCFSSHCVISPINLMSPESDRTSIWQPIKLLISAPSPSTCSSEAGSRSILASSYLRNIINI
ncbi:hypothetical protein [Tolypothrix sp. VBCCA 56010]|uniref:hypothetical protein n=1 Tax=Tolypothrix sp. VBCCA 56010 TaxID=3137731 RepID=UPI003D7D6385